jgi:hypothetical protein
VEKDPQAKQTSMRHVMTLQQRYSNFLSTSTIKGYQRSLSGNITLLGVPNLIKVGPIELVISRWSCQSLS